MSKIIEPLECNIHECGTPFVVTNLIKNTILQPGSTGALSYIMGPDYNNPNIVFQSVIISRRGKGGKTRLDVNTILTSLFKVPEVFFKKAPPKKDSKKFFVDISLNREATSNIIPHEEIKLNSVFIPWLLAKCLLTKKLDKISYTSQCKTTSLNSKKSIHIWPMSKLDPLNIFTSEIKQLVNNGEFGYICEHYNNIDKCMLMVDKLRTLEHSLILAELEYKYKVNSIKLAALKYISNCVQSNAYKIDNIRNFKRSLKKTRRIAKSERSLINDLITHRLAEMNTYRKTTPTAL